MKRILFVDDESSAIEGLKRMLHPFRLEWEMKFAASGPEAIDILARTPVAVIATDIGMPAMNGGELLAEAARRYPPMVRIILSGTENQDSRMKAAVTAHQYLSKPCHGAGLRDVVNRAFALRGRPARPELSDSIGRVEMLPSCPDSHDTLLRLVDSPSASVQPHSEIGSHLLWLWGLSDTIVEAAAFHHDPARAPSGGFRRLTVVHMADAQELGIPMDREYLERVGSRWIVSRRFLKVET